MVRLCTLSALAACALALPQGALAAEPPLLRPALHVHAIEGRSARVTATLPAPARGAVSVDFVTEAGTAKAGSDFVAREGTLTIREGRRRATVSIRTVHDKADELTETFTVRFSGAVGARLGRRTATIVKVLDSNAVIATLDAHAIAEPPGAGDKVPIGAVVRLIGRSAGDHPVTIGYEIVKVEQTLDGNDADVGSGRLHFRAGQTSRVVPGTVKGDALDEDDEHLLVLLTGDRGVYAQLGGTITITDDPADMEPTVSIGDLTVEEGHGGPALVPLTLSAPSERPVRVAFTTATGTAGADDFVMNAGTATSPPDTTTGWVPVALDDDLVDEPDQSFTVTISAPFDAVLGDSEATVTITDDDPAPSVSIADGAAFENAGPGSVAVTLSEISDFDVTVSVVVAGGTATGGGACEAMVDYVSPAPETPVTIRAGTRSAAFSVVLCNDANEEGPKTIALQIEHPGNAILGDAAAVFTLRDDEAP